MKDAGHIASLACAAALAACGDCPDAFELRERRELAPGQRVVLTVPDGRLRIEGRERATSLEIEARGCAAGAEARIALDSTAFDPEGGGASAGVIDVRVLAAHAHVRVWLPTGMPLDVRHGAGDVRLRGTGPATLFTRDGRVVIEQVIGDVRIFAGAGALHVRDVLGDLEVQDEAGALFVDRIGGTLRVRDGAGGIHARDVEGDVVIESDGAGSIEVRRVRGDFVVRQKTDDRHLIRYDSVSGRSRLPSDRLPP
ncbi:MAG TPA: hypothetical protein VMN78_00440 [Longimicrobiales bacterium]|nr:hypothetical protein [Longimicrobiales bacterium]